MKYLFAVTTLCLFSISGLAGCSAAKPSAYEGHQPRLVLEDFFSRKVVGRGAFFRRSGELGTRLLVSSTGDWDGKVLTLREHLTYESGETHDRTYAITKVDEHNYTVQSDELVGPATIESYGNVLRWSYTLKENSKQAGNVALTFDDWMYLSEDGFIINRASGSKYGLGVGEIVLSFSPGT